MLSVAQGKAIVADHGLTCHCNVSGRFQSVIYMQIRTAMDWMRPTRSEQQRYAAALILREMAKNAPAIFNVFVRPFIDVIWFGLRDAKLLVREASRDALRVIPFLLPTPSCEHDLQQQWAPAPD